MQKLFIISSLLLVLLLKTNISSAQNSNYPEKYGTTLNLGLGIGYYGYVGSNIPVFHANLELDVARNFTLSPFITYFSYERDYYWGNKDNPFRNYRYRQTNIPVGLKGTYYFDELLSANSKWDFYLGASLGFTFRRTSWENGYGGSKTEHQTTSGLYLDGHIGTEYHFNKKVGIFLDLSSGVSTLGLAFHL
jgi:hypothetical protein